MRIRTLLVVGTLVTGSVLVGAVVGLSIVARNMERSMDRVNTARVMTEIIFMRASVLDDYLLHPAERPRVQWQNQHRRIEALLGETITAEPDPLLARMDANASKTAEAFARLVASLEENDAQQRQDSRLTELQEHQTTQVRLTSHSMLSLASQFAARENERLQRSFFGAIWLVGLLVATIVILMAGTWFVAGWLVVRPVVRFQQEIRSFKGGAIETSDELNRNDEIGDVARAFQEMASNLDTVMVSREELAKEVDERRRAEEKTRKLAESLEHRRAELAAANKELEAFAYSVSHDLRAPLRSIHGFTEALVEDYSDKLDEQGKDYAQRVRAASVRMGHLIDDILKLSRVSRAKLERREVDLATLAEELIDEIRQKDPTRVVTADIQPDLLAQADAVLMRAVLQNLLENAWKFTGTTAAPVIEVGTERPNGTQIFYVRDNGVGFDMNYAGKLFQPFQRLHADSEFEGTGIGLATVARIIRRHGGEIWAESAPGQGTTMRFTLSPSFKTEGTSHGQQADSPGRGQPRRPDPDIPVAEKEEHI